MSHNESLFYFVRECEIYNSFDCDEIKTTTKKMECKLAICSHCGNLDDHSGRKSEWSEEENLIASNDFVLR